MLKIDVEYQACGLDFIGHYAVDDALSGRRPGILVFPEATGLDDHAKNVATRLAKLGYAALAADYYGGGARLHADQVMPRFSALSADAEAMRTIGKTAHRVLSEQRQTDGGRIAALGYCFGGTMSLELARAGADLRAAVGLHSGLTTTRPEDAKNIRSKVLVCIGADDPFVPHDQRRAFEDEMRLGGVDWTMHLYGGVVHSFTNVDADGSDPALKYDETADRESWDATVKLLASSLV
jgi:dienelactone hydrolase